MPSAGRAPTGDGLLRESTAGRFQGQRGSPDGGQGGAKLVGNRRQEGVLLLVQGSQPSGGLTLGHGVVGDVDLHPLPVAGLAAVVVDKLGFVTEPDRAPIAGEHAVGAAKWFERLVATLVLSEDAVSVRGMEAGSSRNSGYSRPRGRIPGRT